MENTAVAADCQQLTLETEIEHVNTDQLAMLSDCEEMSDSHSNLSIDDDSADEYVPGCKEPVFLGCEHCPSYLCYDHMETVCIEHTRTTESIFRQSENVSSSSDSDICEKKKKKESEKYEKKTVRRIKSEPQKWKKNVRKTARLFGREHINSAGALVRAKCVLPCICSHGRQKAFRCEEFTEDDRQTLNTEYYAAGDYTRQRNFVKSHFYDCEAKQTKICNVTVYTAT